MTMTAERLAELDAVMAKATAGEWGADGVRDNRIVWSGPDTRVCFMAIYPKAHADSLAIVALHNVYPDLRAHIEAQAATIAALQAFKDYVHERLDAAGIPTHPEGKHSAAGCRVGDRLDIALDAQAATIAGLRERMLSDAAVDAGARTHMNERRRLNGVEPISDEDWHAMTDDSGLRSCMDMPFRAAIVAALNASGAS